ncbi:calcium-binding protein [Allorhodopirellula solitaria]|nr:calcium-binding protein [Allorhodopirellula solitaria]
MALNGFGQDANRLVDYSALAFNPDRWREQNVSFQMVPWSGKHVVLLTTPGDYDPKTMTRIIGRLDAGWQLYLDLVGKAPKPLKQIDNKTTICALPKPGLSCGYGCGYVGFSGIEVAGFYDKDFPSVRRNRDVFPHYYFYEMGRNFYLFGDRHSLFTTGYAVFMRCVCMDTLQCQDEDAATRRIIEGCEEVYAKSDLSFLDAFTNLGSGEKSHRLRDPITSQAIIPSDQPVLYAAAMLKLRRHFGGDEWVENFFQALHECPEVKANDERSAIEQSLNWYVCASIAARRDLTDVFVDRWRMPMTSAQLEITDKTDWTNKNLKAADLVSQLVAALE